MFCWFTGGLVVTRCLQVANRGRLFPNSNGNSVRLTISSNSIFRGTITNGGVRLPSILSNRAMSSSVALATLVTLRNISTSLFRFQSTRLFSTFTRRDCLITVKCSSTRHLLNVGPITMRAISATGRVRRSFYLINVGLIQCVQLLTRPKERRSRTIFLRRIVGYVF